MSIEHSVYLRLFGAASAKNEDVGLQYGRRHAYLAEGSYVPPRPCQGWVEIECFKGDLVNKEQCFLVIIGLSFVKQYCEGYVEMLGVICIIYFVFCVLCDHFVVFQ